MIMVRVKGLGSRALPSFCCRFAFFVLSRGCVCFCFEFFLRDSYFKLINHKLLLFEFMWKEGKEWFCMRLIVYLLEYMVCCIWDHHDFIIDRGLRLVCRQIYLELMYDIKNNGVFFSYFLGKHVKWVCKCEFNHTVFTCNSF